MVKGIETSSRKVEGEYYPEKSDPQDIAVETLERNGIDVCEYNVGNTMYQYILHPKDTQKGPGLFIWKLIDFLVNHRDFVVLRKADFLNKTAQAHYHKSLRG